MKIDQDTEYFLVRIILAFFISMLVIAIIKIIDFGSALLKIAYPVATFSGGALIWIFLNT